jgi:cell wall-associated NlpC family hydrolase
MLLPFSLRRFGVVLALSVLIGSIVPLSSTRAGASPIDDKKAEAARLAEAIDANGDKISALDEQMNGARLALQDAQSKIEVARLQIEAAKQRSDALKSNLGRRAASIYTDAASPGVEVGDSLSNSITASARSVYASAAANKTDAMISQLTLVKEQLAEKKAMFEAARSDAQARSAQLDSGKQELLALNSTQEQLLMKTKGELAALVAQEQQRREAAAKAAAIAAIQQAAARRAAATAQAGRPDGGPAGSAAPKPGPGRTGATNTVLPANLPAPSPRAAQAIAFAQAQLGKPYVYAAAGPDTYDCSGLTMRAWGAAGVSMAHYSGAQYAAFPHVPLDQLQPGDLVFRGPGGSAHVGLYIGNGLMIAAPHTGDVVKVQPIRDQLPFGARPG